MVMDHTMLKDSGCLSQFYYRSCGMIIELGCLLMGNQTRCKVTLVGKETIGRSNQADKSEKTRCESMKMIQVEKAVELRSFRN